MPEPAPVFGYLGHRSSDEHAALASAIDAAYERGWVRSRAEAHQRARERDELGSTYVGNGVVLAHLIGDVVNRTGLIVAPVTPPSMPSPPGVPPGVRLVVAMLIPDPSLVPQDDPVRGAITQLARYQATLPHDCTITTDQAFLSRTLGHSLETL